MATPSYADLAKKYGPKVAQYLWKIYSQTPAAYAAGEAATTGAASAGVAGESVYGAGAGGYGMAGAGATSGASAFGAGGVGMGAGAWASVAAPLVMAWLQHQAGSGVNEPVKRQYETAQSGRLLSDILSGRKVDPSLTFEEYGLRPKTLDAMIDPARYGETYTPGAETIDPRGYNAYDLYTRMHDMGSGHYQHDGTGSSGWSDSEIDEMFGPNKDKVAKALGLAALPDWSNQRYDDGTNMQNILALRNKPVAEKWNALDKSVRKQYEDQAKYLGEQTSYADMTSAQDLWQRDQERAEIEKLLGRKLI